MEFLSRIFDIAAQISEPNNSEMEEQSLSDENPEVEIGYEERLETWNRDIRTLEMATDAFEAAFKGKNSVRCSASLEKNEFAIWSSQASLIEIKKLPGQYVGKSAGISVGTPIKGMRLRTGGTKGIFVPGEEVQQSVDSGMVVLTTSRVLFTGSLKTQQWDFAKWIGSDFYEDSLTYMFHVSNHQKVSGIKLDEFKALELYLFLQLVVESQKKRFDGVLSSLAELRQELELRKPTELQ